MLIIQVSPQENDSLRGYFGCKNDEKCATHMHRYHSNLAGSLMLGILETICDPAQ
jgi:hypothetical protein